MSTFLLPRHDGDHSSSAAAAASHDHGSGSTSTAPIHNMAVFHSSPATSLFTTAFTPQTDAQYAGTCIFLVVLAIIFRGLLALKGTLERRWLAQELARRYVVVEGGARGSGSLAESLANDPEARKANLVLSENGLEENVVVVERKGVGINKTRPWRLSVDPVRALVDTVIAGVGYLL
jgi:hypothetical protein